MILFWIALIMILIALTISIVVEFVHEHRKHKQRLYNQRIDQEAYDNWLNSVEERVSNLDVQHRIQNYSAEKPL